MIEPIKGLVESYFETIGELGGRVEATDRERRTVTLAEAMTWAVAEGERTKREKSCVYFVGNGGSAAIASHMAIDWMKNGGFRTHSFNDGALLTCLSNDLGFDQSFALPLSRHATDRDVLIAISSSGVSASILNAVEAARDAGASVLTLSGFAADNPLRELGDMNFYVPNNLYGFVEIAHLCLCHAILDISMGWTSDGRAPAYACAPARSAQ